MIRLPLSFFFAFILADSPWVLAQEKQAQLSAERLISAERIAHGHRQVENMLKDRFRMSAYLTDDGPKLLNKSDPIYSWCVRKFAGEDTGVPIFWDKTLPKQADAEHDPPTTDRLAAIRIRPEIGPMMGKFLGRRKDFELLWCEAIFELNNCAGFKQFNKIESDAHRSKITRDQYIRQMAQVEFTALNKTRKFFEEVWVPWALKNKLRPTYQAELLIWDRSYSDFDSWIEGYTDKKNYPWVPYGGYYDSIRDYVKKHGPYTAPVNNSLPYWKAIQRKITNQRKVKELLDKNLPDKNIP